jgi:hypothetical protein
MKVYLIVEDEGKEVKRDEVCSVEKNDVDLIFQFFSELCHRVLSRGDVDEMLER